MCITFIVIELANAAHLRRVLFGVRIEIEYNTLKRTANGIGMLCIITD